MKYSKESLINGIRNAASNMRKGSKYMWGHMGACNCGHLAQQLTSFTRKEIHEFAQERPGDWKEQVMDFCPTTGYPIDMVIAEMMKYGLSGQDLQQLEDLSNPAVLARLPKEIQPLHRYKREDAILYLESWADILEESLEKTEVSELISEKA